ncbi:MAG: hypothetical protein M1368_04515, partial [Thaumarchaeota archaeon]|nr:hypothetical protein [Nitrososphaerota archaeon]
DPSATIVVNLEADNRNTDWKFYAEYCDVLGLDFYPNYVRSEPVDAAEVNFASQVKRESGLPVFVAETGYPSGPSLFGYSEQKQCDYVKSASSRPTLATTSVVFRYGGTLTRTGDRSQSKRTISGY